MSYRALLADDEPVIVKGLMKMEIWKSMEILPVPAMTGIQALALLKEQEFDLVITDIRMPEMDGLELIARIRETNPDIPIIVLSGYDCFDYAREAIRYHVTDYLLKPISQTELGEIITRLICEIQGKREKRIREEMRKSQGMAEGFGSASSGWGGDEGRRLERQLEQYLMTGEMEVEIASHLGQNFFLGECIPKAGSRQEERYYGSLLLERLRIILGKGEGTAVLFTDHAVFALPSEQDAFSAFLEALRAWEKTLEWTFFVSWLPIDGHNSLRRPYEKLSELSDYGFYCHDFQVLSPDSIEEKPGSPDFSRLEEAVWQEHPVEAYARLQEALERLKDLNKRPAEAREYCLKLYLRLARYPSGPVEDKDLMELLMMKPDSDFERLRAMLFGMLSRWETGCLEKRIASCSATVRTAIRYVHQHLGDERLSLAMVAGKELFLHPDYLGKLFKKETGMSFTRYVTELRMERAKERIEEDPEIKVYELSEEVGFGNSPHYFGQMFRQVWGCTPTEYKKAQKEKRKKPMER